MTKFDGLRWRVCTLIAKQLLSRRGVQLGKAIKFDGLPIVTGAHLGEVSIGDRAVLVGNSKGTALGVRGPVILRLLTEGARLTIGEDSGLSGTVICAASSVKVGARALIGADVMIFDTDFHNPEAPGRRYATVDWKRISKPVVIEEDVFIGTRSIIAKGVTIGRGSIVGAGSIVTASIPPYSVAAGVPAKVISKVRES